jgi:hypothetical protein
VRSDRLIRLDHEINTARSWFKPDEFSTVIVERRMSEQLEALDLIARTGSSWAAGPSARSLLPGANLLADGLRG